MNRDILVHAYQRIVAVQVNNLRAFASVHVALSAVSSSLMAYSLSVSTNSQLPSAFSRVAWLTARFEKSTCQTVG